eukprot:m.162934 g.162934  ORF g.162934 m.162934 type:complete len:72 (-) comp9873_c0_seq4:345-560(-)
MLATLTRRFLSSNTITALPTGVFAGLTSLQYLFLSSNAITALPTGIFAGLTSLQTLCAAWMIHMWTYASGT